MGKKITESERKLMEELLEAHSPEHVAMLMNRSIRSAYYIKAEMNRGKVINQYEKPFLKRLWARLTGGEIYEERNDTSPVGKYRRQEV